MIAGRCSASSSGVVIAGAAGSCQRRNVVDLFGCSPQVLELAHRKGTGSRTRIYCATRPEAVKIFSSYSSDSADGAPFSSRMPAIGVVKGAMGLLLIAGSLGIAAKLMWQKASHVASLPSGYEATLEFPFASGITIGTVVRTRGVEIGSVVRVRPCLERIDAQIKVIDSMSYIPRNALVEVNQSGLVGETIIDIMPRTPIPRPVFGPLDPDCPSEGLIVCHKERITGQQGVSMDDLIRLCGKMSKNIQESDVRNFVETAEYFENTLSNSKVVLGKLEKFAGVMEPVAKELHEHGILRQLSELLKQTSKTMQTLRMSKVMKEPRRSFTNSVSNLATTINNMESSSTDATEFFSTEKNRKNMKHLIELLSRLVDG